ncbi:hypothetical protein [Rhodococcus sp. RS1C4]|nr:hypothetical protein [Rhodococcus sp. RS1C4]
MDAVDAAAYLAAGTRGEIGVRSTVMSTAVALSAVDGGAAALRAL